MPLTASDAIDLLRNAHAQNRLAHAYLITGPQGSGKRQLAVQFCGLLIESAGDALRHPDVHIIEPESRSRRIVIDQIRDLEHALQMRSSCGGRKAGVIFDADRLQVQASNAFLKTLEEPPRGTHLILVTSFPDQLLETILSRCIEVPLQPTTLPEATPRQRALLEILGATAKENRFELPQIFALVRDFQRLLGEAREAAQERSDAEAKAEELRYKSFADAKWFEEREDYFKALTEARYVAERARLLETLEAWQADILRQQAVGSGAVNGAVRLDLPELTAQTGLQAQQSTPAKTLRRVAALETLRGQLGNPGIQEQLAIEVAFLKTFGD